MAGRYEEKLATGNDMQDPNDRPTFGTPVMVDQFPGIVRMEFVVVTAAVGLNKFAPLPTAYRF